VGHNLLKPDRAVIALNLQRVLGAKGIGVRELSRLVKEAIESSGEVEPRNVSYGTIRAYTLGKAAPRVEALRWIAKVLQVREKWLIYNEGEPTEEAQRLMAAHKGHDTPSEKDEIYQRIDEVFPEFELLPDDSHLLVMTAISRYINASADGTLTETAFDIFLSAMRQAVLGPLFWRAHVTGMPIDSSDPAQQDFLRTAVSAFILAIPPRIEGAATDHWPIAFEDGQPAEGTYRVSFEHTTNGGDNGTD
jgi:transcriptional regulator with XRE-family HTH domain